MLISDFREKSASFLLLGLGTGAIENPVVIQTWSHHSFLCWHDSALPGPWQAHSLLPCQKESVHPTGPPIVCMWPKGTVIVCWEPIVVLVLQINSSPDSQLSFIPKKDIKASALSNRFRIFPGYNLHSFTTSQIRTLQIIFKISTFIETIRTMF